MSTDSIFKNDINNICSFFDKLLLRVQKKKKTNMYHVIDGIISYHINVNKENIYCPCNTFIKPYSYQLCKHIVFFLYKQNIDMELLIFWHQLKKYILSDLSNVSDASNTSNTSNVSNKLWRIVGDQILNGECGFCLEKIFDGQKHSIDYVIKNIHMCEKCRGIVHIKCFNKWCSKTNKCMLCRG
jgi:hypothetical protein